MNDEHTLTVQGKSTFVVIPALDPDQHLIPLITELYFDGFRIVVVDDGSTEDCAPIWDAIQWKAIVLHHAGNEGKGAALKTAFRYLLDCEPDAGYIVTADADGQHRPEDIRALAYRAWTQPGVLFLGSRDFSLENVPLRSRIGNRAMCALYRWACGTELPDTQTGLRAFDRSLLRYFCAVPGMRYEYEMNVLLACGQDMVAMEPVKIQTVYWDKSNSASHFQPLRDSLRVIKTFAKFFLYRAKDGGPAPGAHAGRRPDPAALPHKV